MADALLPCPFCGEPEPRMEATMTDAVVKCRRCVAKVVRYAHAANAGGVLDQAIAAWNTRLDLHLAALAERDARIAALRSALDGMAEAFDEHVVIPHRNCSCHLNPPCGDCVTWDFARDARKTARALLDGGKATP